MSKIENIKFLAGLISMLFLLPMKGFAQPEKKIVSNLAQFQALTKSLVAGDTVVLANGIWRDAELVFGGEGTASLPIVMMAETSGKVFLEGKSNLRIGGNYLVVKGLVFRNGFTPSSEVISYSIDSKTLAFNSRITECVIDNFNNPDRNAQDSWVMMYGKNNRFDHNHIEGKRNVGVTMAVRLNSENSLENSHIIDHNYFGPRPVLGSNGGETLRIGTSQYSLTNSNTMVENNYFDQCNGETEIISVKSGGNIIRGNVFFESKGSLTLRHGNGNIVEENVFLGNGKPETGGIRVINADHKIRGNYMLNLGGEDFRSGISIMNGVPNSSINRYHQVKNVEIRNNSLINVARIELAVGSDAERSATPENCEFSENLITSKSGKDIFKSYDKIDGIAFSKNISNFNSVIIGKGLSTQNIKLEKAPNGLLYPVDISITAGASRDLKVIAIQETGPTWYPKISKEIVFGIGKRISVSPGVNKISDALKQAENGDILVLDAGKYEQTKVLDITFPVTISSTQKAQITFEGTNLFEIYDGGALSLVGIHVCGEGAADAAGNAIIRIYRAGTLKNYKLKVEGCEFTNMTVNHSFNFLEASKGSFADSILIRNSHFKNITGSILTLDKESDDLGKYNAEYLILEENQFEEIGGVIADVYRGGTDESTFGPYVFASKNQISQTGKSNRNKEEASFALVGVQQLVMTENSFKNSAPPKVIEWVGKPFTSFANNTFEQTPAVIHIKNQQVK